jgi:hypothetical protein
MGRAMSGVRAAVVSMVVAAAAIFGLSAPAQAAYPSVWLDVAYGSSLFTGTATFYNQSVGVSGTLKVAAGACMRLHAQAAVNTNDFAQVSTSLKCGGTTTYKNHAVSLTAPAPVAGGANWIWVYLYDENGNFLNLDGEMKP